MPHADLGEHGLIGRPECRFQIGAFQHEGAGREAVFAQLELAQQLLYRIDLLAEESALPVGCEREVADATALRCCLIVRPAVGGEDEVAAVTDEVGVVVVEGVFILLRGALICRAIALRRGADLDVGSADPVVEAFGLMLDVGPQVFHLLRNAGDVNGAPPVAHPVAVLVYLRPVLKVERLETFADFDNVFGVEGFWQRQSPLPH